MPFQIRQLAGSLRLTIGCFAVLVLSFALLAQRNLWEQAGGGGMPTPQRVLERYHGVPGSSRLHIVLDPNLPDDDVLAMYGYLGETDAVRAQRRTAILAWVDRGAPESEWNDFAPIFTGEDTCGACHTAGGTAEFLKFDTYEQVKPVAQIDAGMPLGKLLISAHNHMFGFAVMALLLSVLLCASRVTGVPRTVLILAAFAGPLLDIGGWFLTRSFGAPFHWMVMAGGAMFGAATTLMAVIVLRDAVKGSGAKT